MCRGASCVKIAGLSSWWLVGILHRTALAQPPAPDAGLSQRLDALCATLEKKREDYHIPGMITLALVGEVLDNDAAREVLEPYRGDRYRVQQLVVASGIRPERRGPRRTLPTHLPC